MKVLLEQGEATLSNIGQLRNARFGQAILLSGGNGRYELITPETPLEMVKAYLGRYKYFVRLSTTHQETVEKAEARSADGRKFRLTINIGARLADPLVFVRAYGHDSSLLAPFHKQTLSDVQNLLLSYTQSQVDAVSAQLAMRFGAVATKRPVYDGVELQEYIVNVEQDPDVRREMIAIETTSIYDRFGAKGLAALMLRHPQHKSEISAFADDLVALGDKFEDFDDRKFERALKRANQLEADGVIGQDEKAQFLQLQEMKNVAQETTQRGASSGGFRLNNVDDPKRVADSKGKKDGKDET